MVDCRDIELLTIVYKPTYNCRGTTSWSMVGEKYFNDELIISGFNIYFFGNIWCSIMEIWILLNISMIGILEHCLGASELVRYLKKK